MKKVKKGVKKTKKPEVFKPKPKVAPGPPKIMFSDSTITSTFNQPVELVPQRTPKEIAGDLRVFIMKNISVTPTGRDELERIAQEVEKL